MALCEAPPLMDQKRLKSTREDRKNLAIALSGFANAEGGLIVWGIVGRRNQGEEVDCAIECKPIQNVDRALTDITSASAAATSPLPDGVQTRAIRETETTGYLLTIVPATDGQPRMAKHGVDQYFKRTGDRFAKMEHYEIADMFGRRQRPKLGLQLELRRGGISGFARGDRQCSIRILVALENVGRHVARFPLLGLQPPRGFGRRRLFGREFGLKHLLRREGESGFVLAGGVDDVVHPGTQLDVIEFEHGYPENDAFADVVFAYYVAADGLPRIDDEQVVRGTEIEALVKKAFAERGAS